MYGYATNESDNYLPLPINLAHKLSKKLQEVREN
jgi:S-adenosylmethionine synthetase